MKKANRVHSHQDFSDIIHQHNSYRGKFATVCWVKKTDNFVRVGVSVGKKNGGATTRVRIKRQVRAICDQLLKTSDPYDVIVIVKPGYTPEDRNEIFKDISEAITKIGE